MIYSILRKRLRGLLPLLGTIAIAYYNLYIVGGLKKQPHLSLLPTSIAGLPRDTKEENAPSLLAPFESPLLLFTCSRAKYLRETLNDVEQYLRNDCVMGCPVIISQDGDDANVAKVIQDFQVNMTQRSIPVVHLRYSSSEIGRRNPYQQISEHYGWAIEHVFTGGATSTLDSSVGPLASPKRVLILEEDLHISPDFFDYFSALAPMLDKDATLLAISAFNDNGFASKVKDTQRLVRTDFFPGLGWMMTRRLWQTELSGHWPIRYWDDWLREKEQRKGRQIIRPEVSRSFHFGVSGGASGNQYGELLAQVKLNTERINWLQYQQNLTVSMQADRFHNDYMSLVQSARPAVGLKEALQRVRKKHIRLEYSSFGDFRRFAKALGLMEDIRSETPRTSYNGIVETRPFGGFFLFLTPSLARKGGE